MPETQNRNASTTELSHKDKLANANEASVVVDFKSSDNLPSVKVGGGGIQGALFEGLDGVELPAQKPPKLSSKRIKNLEELRDGFAELNIKTYPLRTDLNSFEPRLRTEERPSVINLSAITRSLALGLEFSPDDITEAVSVASGNLRATEQVTELTTGVAEEDCSVGVPLRRDTLVIKAWQTLRVTINLEDADIRLFLSILEQRLKESQTLERLLLVTSTPLEQQRAVIRDVGLALTVMLQPKIAEQYQHAVAEQVHSTLAERIPDIMVFPEGIPLLPSRRNIYGVTPPTIREDLPKVEHLLLHEERRFLKDAVFNLEDGSQVSVGYYDGATGVYNGEKTFSQKLDQAPFVVWWHRNPDRKPFSVALARPDSARNFYPDFIICVRYYEGDQPSIRLVDTKHDMKDIVKKSRRNHLDYKRVIFLTEDKENGNFNIVNENGTLGPVVDSSLDALKDFLRKSEST